MKDRLLDIAETAQVLGRSQNAVRRMVERRKLPFRKSGRRVLFLESEIRSYIESLPGLSLEDMRERERDGV